MRTDFLVIGSGIAGLSYALKVAKHFPDKTITVITKTNAEETNTKYAQGGVAGVWDDTTDSYEKHIEDTLVAGDGLCNKAIVEIVVKEGPNRIQELIGYGAEFDKDASGQYALGREGGHSAYRILHHKDVTGQELERALLNEVQATKNIQLIHHWFVVDLITQHHLGYLVTKSTQDIQCYGVYVLNTLTNEIEKVLAKITVLATGGCGQVYRTTTNPTIATGDGVAMVYRAKGRIENMEFIQFHPTALYQPGVSPSFLITEAVRGDGGILRNKQGEAFMEKYDERKDLAPRDIVARAIDNEMKKDGTEHVYLDCRHMDMGKFKHHFPNIYEKCLSIGIDVSRQMIPVAPAAHYSCGGIKTNEWGESSIQHLFACGECASTGLHGANRLASNSLLEAMVFAHRSYLASVEQIVHIAFQENIPDWNALGTTHPKEMILITQSRKELEQLMSDYVGIVRTDIRLQRAMKRLDLLYEETEQLYRTAKVSPQLCELRNVITVGYLVVKGAMFRKESRGLHFNTDHPEKSALLQNIVL
ncbi:MAG: L-aspartate oxidase [Hydrotalea flava]|uniref:L-aspartate oxidase n=1 Tax=Hydrotalea TaxID=1004300 RepID=UPI000945DD41|nr:MULTISPECIES: L-aspartate oxidase [Hydrotalea]MBY0349118.1 L-aspartate oxidase [Hydrotalea flava]NIM36136.1 L-aspartate oxidase [Hydrotalea flava]NIM38983.1 L-aspartate oxidase [Hydrotalea flava]NIN04172.1 L-aspartate oxidase [Hydrotalea flava]NIN15845.1 L-aspartate oxidase [Hydrotalea flava]